MLEKFIKIYRQYVSVAKIGGGGGGNYRQFKDEFNAFMCECRK
jgi:hypothetical protein